MNPIIEYPALEKYKKQMENSKKWYKKQYETDDEFRKKQIEYRIKWNHEQYQKNEAYKEKRREYSRNHYYKMKEQRKKEQTEINLKKELSIID